MPPAGKRKANAMLDRIEKMAKQSEFDEERKKSDKYEVERKEYFESARAMFEESEKKETKEQYFDRLLKESTSLDKVLEFLKFRKQADKLLPNLREEMIKLVKKELEIDEALENLSLESNIATEEGTPLLEALGAKMGTSFANILTPPTQQCILCKADLIKNNEPSVVVLFTLSGPVVAAKHTWRCRNCKGEPLLLQQTVSQTEEIDMEARRDVHYSPDSFGNNEVRRADLIYLLMSKLILICNLGGIQILWREIRRSSSVLECRSVLFFDPGEQKVI